MKKKAVTWLAVIDSKHAYFFAKGLSNKLEKISAVTAKPIRTNPSTRRSMGRAYDRKGGGRHIIEPHTSEKVQEQQLFVKDITAYLEKSLKDKVYSQLILVAPSKMLGFFHKAFSKKLQEAAVLEINKDWVHFTAQEIQRKLHDVIRIK